MPQPEPIDPGKYNFLTVMNDIENGRVRLPPFQREFVWSASKVLDLMDSIYKGFPVGSFFYWKADRKYVTLFRDILSTGFLITHCFRHYRFVGASHQRSRTPSQYF